jgi:hypothetical protein
MHKYASFFRISLLLACPAWIAIASLSGCKEKTTEPLTPEETVRSILTPEMLDTLKKLGMVFNDGGNPPNIEGSFYANKKRLIGSNVPGDTLMKPFGNTSIKFSGQTGDQHIRVEYQQGSVGSGEGLGAIITGTDDRFTVYVQANVQSTRHDTTITAVSAACYSGRVDAEGIHDLMNSTLITRKDTPDPNNIVIPVGKGRVIIETDSLAARVPDYPHDTTTAGVGKTGAGGVYGDTGP